MFVVVVVATTTTTMSTPVYGQSFSDATGILNRLDVSASGYTFQVEIVSNFNIADFRFDEDEKKLTLSISSGLENNLGEVIIPNDLLGGDLTFYLNDQQYFPTVNTNQQISFVTLKFEGSGENKLEIVGTTHLSGLVPKDGAESDDVLEPEASSLFLLQESDASDGSLEWQILVSILVTIVVVVLIVVKLRKRR